MLFPIRYSERKTVLATLLLTALTLPTTSLAAAITIDLTSLAGATSLLGDTTDVSTIDFSEGAVTGTVTGYGKRRVSGGRLRLASLTAWRSGLGVCNAAESRSRGGCNTARERQVDASGRLDYVVFAFDDEVRFDNVTIDPFGIRDRDTRHWIGSVDDASKFSLLGARDAGIATWLGTGAVGPVDDLSESSRAPRDVDLGSVIGNVLVLRALGNDDFFTVSSLTIDHDPAAVDGDLTAVPLPAAAWLFGSALVGMAGLGCRRVRRT